MNGIPALAQAVQSQGRGKDTQLVHMTPNEVQGLQAIAMAHGGSLTINPQTGLPEAGFLDSILPVLAGAALTIGTGGVINPLMAAGIVGGGTALVTGDIGKGFQAGLGAYGGGGLGAGLSAAGASTAAAAPGTISTSATPSIAPVAEAVTPDMIAPVSSVGTPMTAPGGLSASEMLRGAQPATIGSQAIGDVAARTVTTPAVAPMLDASTLYGPSSAPTMGYNFSQAGEGLKALASPEGRSAFMSGVGGLSGLAKYGGAAALPLLSSDAEGAPAGTPQMIRPYTYDPGRQDVTYRTGAIGESTAEQEYFRPRYTPMPIYRAKTGGSVPELEEGGFVMTKKAVDGMGDGDNKKGQEALKKGLGAIPIKGKGTGTSDSIKTTIAGKVPAKVSNGEAYISKKNVKKAGGTTNMYALMRKAERRA